MNLVDADITIIQPKSLQDYYIKIYKVNKIQTASAYFGVAPYGRKIIGQIVTAKDNLGCSPITLLNSTDETMAKFLLLDVGGCPNTLKAKYAQDTGISCTILINTDDRDLQYVNIYDDSVGLDIQIPTIVVKKSDGESLKQSTLESSVEISIQFDTKKAFSKVQLDI